MAQKELFSDLEIAAFRAGITPRTKESIAWFKQKAGQLGKVTGGTIFNQEQVKMQASLRNPLGNMYMFYYNAKHREKLPYFDAFPLVVITSLAEGGFYGMNLHYLPPPLRAKALNGLMGSDGLPAKYYRPTIHRYLTSQVRSKFALIDKPEWEIATFLPAAQWRGAGVGKVYQDSRSKIRNG